MENVLGFFRNFALAARSYFRSKMKRKTSFPFAFCSLIRNFAGKNKGYERQDIYQFRLGVEAPVARQGKLWCAGGHGKITDNGSRTDTVGHTVLPKERHQG